jgi:hypothetical protein
MFVVLLGARVSGWAYVHPLYVNAVVQSNSEAQAVVLSTYNLGKSQ